ncbi:hypothetical protein ACMFMG_004911 [Clarireedia jacksonii]
MWKFLSQQIGKLQTLKRPRENDEAAESSSPSPSHPEPSVDPAPPSPVGRGTKRRKLSASLNETIKEDAAVDVPFSRSGSGRGRKSAKAPESPVVDEVESFNHTETTPNIGHKIKDESESEAPMLSTVEEPHVTPVSNARGGGRKRKLAEAVGSPVDEKPIIEATPRTSKRRTRTPAKLLAGRELSTDSLATTTKRPRKSTTRFSSEPMDGPPEATTPETRAERRRYMDRQRQRRHRERKRLKAQEELEAQRVKQQQEAEAQRLQTEDGKDERKKALARERQRRHRQSQKERQKSDVEARKIKKDGGSFGTEN